MTRYIYRNRNELHCSICGRVWSIDPEWLTIAATMRALSDPFRYFAKPKSHGKTWKRAQKASLCTEAAIVAQNGSARTMATHRIDSSPCDDFQNSGGFSAFQSAGTKGTGHVSKVSPLIRLPLVTLVRMRSSTRAIVTLLNAFVVGLAGLCARTYSDLIFRHGQMEEFCVRFEKMAPNVTRWCFTGRNCTQPAIDDFPKDFFTEKEREAGAVVLHVIASLYLFAALAVVCDKFFVPAVDRICQGIWKLSHVSRGID